jgi:general secretion pathway protein H
MSARGFTLLELLVVLTIVMAVVGVAAPILSKGLPGTDLRSGKLAISSGLRDAQSQAMATNKEVAFTLNVDAKWFAVGERERTEHVPDSLQLSFLTARSERLDRATANIRFYPDGSSTGGRIELEGGDRKAVVTVDWLTGRVAATD